MLRLKQGKPIHADIPVIVDNYRILHFDEVPVLFVGTNKYSTWIIGSSMEEDDKRRIERCLHVPVTYASYAAFMNGRISYREIITSAATAFVVEKPYDGKMSEMPISYLVEPKNIPPAYLPSEDSYCPMPERIASTIYVAKLQGGLADDHAAKPSDLGEIQVLLGNIIERIYGVFEKYLGKPTAVLHPATAGSFELNYAVRFVRPSQGTLFPREPQQYDLFVQDFIRYCLNGLPKDLPNLTRELLGSAPNVEALNKTDAVFRLMEAFPWMRTQEDPVGILKRTILPTATDLDNISQTTIGESYKSIALANRVIRDDATTDDQVLGVVDDVFIKELGEATEIVSKETNRFDEDDEAADPKRYTIIVYSINRETRKGKARIKNDHRTDGSWSQPTIAISGDEPLEGSDYTLSLHEDRELEVLGYAKRMDGKYRHIKIVGVASTA